MGRRSSAAVLTWITGRVCDPAELALLFRLRKSRVIQETGCIRFWHWRLSGERGLAGERPGRRRCVLVRRLLRQK
jgi:hypothetical protein